MTPAEAELQAVVAEWMKFADDDLQAAELLRRGGLLRQATYHAQQAAEKFIKAALIRHQVPSTLAATRFTISGTA